MRLGQGAVRVLWHSGEHFSHCSHWPTAPAPRCKAPDEAGYGQRQPLPQIGKLQQVICCTLRWGHGFAGRCRASASGSGCPLPVRRSSYRSATVISSAGRMSGRRRIRRSRRSWLCRLVVDGQGRLPVVMAGAERHGGLIAGPGSEVEVVEFVNDALVCRATHAAPLRVAVRWLSRHHSS